MIQAGLYNLHIPEWFHVSMGRPPFIHFHSDMMVVKHIITSRSWNKILYVLQQSSGTNVAGKSTNIGLQSVMRFFNKHVIHNSVSIITWDSPFLQKSSYTNLGSTCAIYSISFWLSVFSSMLTTPLHHNIRFFIFSAV